MMKTIFAGALLLACARAYAWELPTSVKSVRSPGIVDSAGLTASPSGYEAFVQGAVTFEHAGRKYALKTIFSPARYDAGVDTYKAGLRYQLADYTNPEDISFWVPINPETKPVAEYSNGYDGTKLRIESGKKSVDITAETNGKSKRYKISIKEMMGNWENNARGYRKELGGQVWHFVPQVVWQPDGNASWFSRGYAVGGETPFDALTGRPLDAIRLCSSLDNWHGCQVGNYVTAVASGLSFFQATADIGGELRVEIMSAGLMREVIRDELNGNCWHYNCKDGGTIFDNW